jgi:hypothetical protein
MQFHIDSMTNSGFALAVTTAIQALDPMAAITTHPAARTITVDSVLSEATLRAILTAAGFPPR